MRGIIASIPEPPSHHMTPELRALLQSLAANLKTLAEAVSTLAGNMDYPQTERKARLVASELADANLTLEEV